MREKKVWDDFPLCLFPPSVSLFFIKFMRNKKDPYVCIVDGGFLCSVLGIFAWEREEGEKVQMMKHFVILRWE